jgi:hypothetical protein
LRIVKYNPGGGVPIGHLMLSTNSDDVCFKVVVRDAMQMLNW